jgi:hypothetical protein
MFFFFFLIGSVGLQIWAWRSLTVRLAGGTATRLQSVLRYAGWALVPLLLLVGGFAAMIGIEELFDVALVGERSGLLAIPVFGLSVLGTLAFMIRCAGGRTLSATCRFSFVSVAR